MTSETYTESNLFDQNIFHWSHWLTHSVLLCLADYADLDFSWLLKSVRLVTVGPCLVQQAGIQGDVPVASGLLKEAVLGVHRTVRIHFGIPATGTAAQWWQMVTDGDSGDGMEV